MTEPERRAEPADLARFEPTPYDLGITNDPDLTWPDAEPCTYVTEVWSPPIDDGVHRLHTRMPDPEPLPQPEQEKDVTTPEPQITDEEIGREPPATAAEWLEAGPEDRHPYAFEPRVPTGPEAGDPWADPDWRPDPAPPMSDGFYRAVADYCHAENAKAEPEAQPAQAVWAERSALVVHEPEPEPDLGPTKEELEQGFEPDDAIDHQGRTPARRVAEPIIDPPDVADELDLAAAYLQPAPLEREAEPEAEPEAGL